MTERIKVFLKSFILTRPIYRGWRYIKGGKVRRIQKNLRLKGIETLLFLEETLASHIFFFLDMGTLLGIIREGRLLGHDLDIDVAVYAENESEKEFVTRLLLSAGCKLTYTYFVETLGVVEQSFTYNNVKFDINYYIREFDKDICYLMYRDPRKTHEADELDVVKLSIRSVERVKRIPFAGKEVTVPEHPEAYLAERYGASWRIPDTNYVYWQGPSCEYTEYKGYKRIDYLFIH